MKGPVITVTDTNGSNNVNSGVPDGLKNFGAIRLPNTGSTPGGSSAPRASGTRRVRRGTTPAAAPTTPASSSDDSTATAKLPVTDGTDSGSSDDSATTPSTASPSDSGTAPRSSDPDTTDDSDKASTTDDDSDKDAKPTGPKPTKASKRKHKKGKKSKVQKLKKKLRKKLGLNKKKDKDSKPKRSLKRRLITWAVVLVLCLIGYQLLKACNEDFQSGGGSGPIIVAPNGVAPDNTSSKPKDITVQVQELAEGKKITAVFEQDKSISFDVTVDGDNVPTKIAMSDGMRNINGNVRIGSGKQVNDSIVFCNESRGGVCNVSVSDSICDLWIAVKFQKGTDYRMFFINAIDLFNAKAPGTSQAYPGEEHANGMCGVEKP